MKKITAAIATLVFCAASAAYAGGTAPGTPGTANCKGQTVAYLAQLGKNADAGFRGIGGLGNYFSASTKEIMALSTPTAPDLYHAR